MILHPKNLRLLQQATKLGTTGISKDTIDIAQPTKQGIKEIKVVPVR